MSAFVFRVWRFGIAHKGISRIFGWRHLIWRIWWLDGNDANIFYRKS